MKFNFRLQPLLRLREMAVQKAKVQVGRCQKNVIELKRMIKNFYQQVSDLQLSQNTMLDEGLSGKELKFYPFFQEAKLAHIDQLKDQLKEAEVRLEDALKDLSKKEADLKVMEKLRDKKKEDFKKELNKYEQRKLDEQITMWLHHKD